MTTILSVRRGGSVAVGGDGQVTVGGTALKVDAVKIREIQDGRVICGFAGGVADAFALLERFEEHLRKSGGNTLRGAIALAKEWRMDKALRRLESLMAVVDAERSLLLSGQGDVIEPSDGVLGIGSGGDMATAAARALLRNTDLSAEDVVRQALEAATELDIHSGGTVTVHTLDDAGEPPNPPGTGNA